MLGPGHYDLWCTKVREETHADGAIVIVLGGKNGSGFSVQGPLAMQLKLPKLLRKVADDIEKGLSQAKL